MRITGSGTTIISFVYIHVYNQWISNENSAHINEKILILIFTGTVYEI